MKARKVWIAESSWGEKEVVFTEPYENGYSFINEDGEGDYYIFKEFVLIEVAYD